MSTVREIIAVLDECQKKYEFTWLDLFYAADKSTTAFSPHLWVYQRLFEQFCDDIKAGNNRPLTSEEEKLLERVRALLTPETPVPKTKTAA